MTDYARHTLSDRALADDAARQRPSFKPRAPRRGPHQFPGGLGPEYRYGSRCANGCGARVDDDRLTLPAGTPPLECPNAGYLAPTPTPRAGRVFVRGRYTPLGKRFDVLKIEGQQVELYARDCVWPEEALELAVACLRGRFVAPPVRGSRASFTQGRAGIMVPAEVSLKPQSGARFVRRSEATVEVIDES